MSKVVSTVLFVDNTEPYFLVTNEENCQFPTTLMHESLNDTALGAVLREYENLGIKSFEDWRLHESITFKTEDEDVVPFYSFELVKDLRQEIEKQTNNQLIFKHARYIHQLLEQVEFDSFASFE